MPGFGDEAERRQFRRQLTFVATWGATLSLLVASTVLLGVASVTRAPGNATNVQTQPSEQCPRASWFVGILSVSCARLGLSFLCTSWLFIRKRRKRLAQERMFAQQLEALELGNVAEAEAAANNAAALNAAAGRSTLSLITNNSPNQHSRPPSHTHSPPPSASGRARSVAHNNTPPSVYNNRSSVFHRSNTSVLTYATANSATSPRSVSPAAHLYTVPQGADTYTSLTGAMSSNPHAAASMPSLALAAQSTPSLNRAAMSTASLKRYSGSGSVSPAAHLYTFPPGADTTLSLASHRASLTSPTAAQSPSNTHPHTMPAGAASTVSLLIPGTMTPARGSTTSLHATNGRAGTSTPSLRIVTDRPEAASTVSIAYPPAAASGAASRTHSSASRYPEPYVPKAERRKQQRTQWGANLDKLAESVVHALSYVNFFLWALGSGFLFSSIPTVTRHACYNGAPLLWWNLMVTVILFGWLLVLYYVYIVLATILFVLGHTIYFITAYIMGWPIRPLVQRPRTPQPEKLTEHDLLSCPIVAYVPDPTEPLPEPSIYDGASKAESVYDEPASPSKKSKRKKQKKTAVGLDAEKSAPTTPVRDEPKGEPVQPGDVDASRLNGLPGVVLSAHQATCAICQSSFIPPREVPGRIMYEVERLRQLPCKHVFHQACVDNWLVNHSGICPYCNRLVKDLISDKNKEEGAAAPEGEAVADVPDADPEAAGPALQLPAEPPAAQRA